MLEGVGGGVEDSLLVVYHKKRLVSSLPENHYGERFCGAWAAILTWGLLRVEMLEQEREKGSFSLISPIGVVAGATSTPLGNS